MTITATAFGGVTVNSNTGDFNPGSLASVSGDRVVVVYAWFDTGTAATQAAGTVTSTPAKTFTKDTEFRNGSMGIAVYSWVSDGTTLTQINVAPTAGSSVGNVAGGTVLVHSTVGTVTYDSTTKGTGTDATSPLAWSAGGAVSGTQIGLLAVVIDNGAAGTFTASSGYTMFQEHGDGTTSLTNHEAYKVNETGTPALSVAYSAAITAAAELFVSFQEPGGAVAPSSAPAAAAFGPGSLGPLFWQWIQRSGVDAAGQQFTISPTGSMTASGVLTNQDRKNVAGSMTPAGALTKQTGTHYTGSMTATGALAKRTNKALTGSMTASGVLSVVKVAILNVAGSMTASGVLTKQDRKNIAGSMTSSGALARQTGKALAGSMTASGALTKQTRKFFAGSMTASGVLSIIKVAILNLAGSMTASGTLKRQTGKALGGTVTASGAVTKQTGIHPAGAMTASGALAKQARKFFAGALTAVGNLVAFVPGAILPGSTHLTVDAPTVTITATAPTVTVTAPHATVTITAALETT